MIAEMASLRGTKFDPALLDAFLPLAPELHAGHFDAPEARVVASDRPGVPA